MHKLTWDKPTIEKLVELGDDFIAKWSIEHYEPIATITTTQRFGGDLEPYASIYMAAFAQAIGARFAEGMKILDYGCGAGKFLNFTAKRLRNFRYWGVEKGGSGCAWGEQAIEQATLDFVGDSRSHFGLIGTGVEHDGLENAEVILLISIFTHMDHFGIVKMLRHFKRVVDRGAILVFSVHHRIDNRQEVEGGSIYGLDGFYQRTYVSRDMLDRAARLLGWSLTLESRCRVSDIQGEDGEKFHFIYKISRNITK